MLAFALLRHLAFPLFWADEAETAMFAQRVAEYGYPRVHGERNVVYQFGPNIAVGIDEASDAYIGTTWGQFYFALPGLLWARGSDDPYVRTFRMRLPFALAGAAGIGVWLWALLPVFAGEPRRARRFAALYLLLTALSVSLLLHLREVRYYALVVLLSGGVFRLHLGYAVYDTTGYRRWCVGLALLLWLLFNCFFQAFFSFAALLGAERLWALRCGRAGLRDLVPFAAAGAAVAPLLVYYETFSTAAAFREGLDFGVRDYLANLAAVGLHLLRHEFLAPALVLRGLAWRLGAAGAVAGRVAGGLLLFAAGSVVLGCLNPLPLERYFVALSPLLTGAFLLDAFALARALPARAPAARRRGAAAATVAGLALLTAGLRLPAFEALGGRLVEWREPYRGPVDHAVAHLRQVAPRPEELVIATNYEEYAFMYYLRSHVVIGLALNNLIADRQTRPDVVIPRRGYPRSLAALGPFLREGEWEPVHLPVRDLYHNNTPALSPSRYVPEAHHFRTPHSDDPDEQLVVYWRSSSSKRTGTSSRP